MLARSGVKMLNIREDSRTKKSITLIQNNDRLCCARASNYHTNKTLGKDCNK
jgi:hypothetical protein